MDLQQWLIYLSVVIAVIVMPGPSALLCLTHGVAHGPWRTLATVAGGMLASLTLMGLSALGLGAVIAASGTLFQIVKLAGAIYLVWLGVSIWRAAPAARPAADAPAAPARAAAPLKRLFANGLLVGIGNPKDLLFFGALFPQFLDPAAALAPQLALLAATWLVVDGLAMSAYAASGARVARGLARLGAGRLFNRVTGGAFIAAGGALAAAQR